MSIAVSQDLARSQNVADIIGNKPVRAVKSPGNDRTAEQLPQQTQQGSGVKSSAAVISRLDDERNQQAKAGYDAPAPQYQKAVDAYQSFASMSQRDQIQQYFSVDLFA